MSRRCEAFCQISAVWGLWLADLGVALPRSLGRRARLSRSGWFALIRAFVILFGSQTASSMTNCADGLNGLWSSWLLTLPLLGTIRQRRPVSLLVMANFGLVTIQQSGEIPVHQSFAPYLL
ncbi:hypothetical protein PMIT1320_00405 [Prochlorococcus marinus str. MIT 1320]|nr:hypothetical protein PMIT1320_00405 [Prochlorococcus marinus str. MIT 1320]